MADLFNDNELGVAPRRQPKKPSQTPQIAGEQAGIDAALNIGAQPRTPTASAAPPAATAPPSLNDLTSASGGVTPPSLRNGGVIDPSAVSNLTNQLQQQTNGTGISGSGTLTQPIGLGNYANNLEGFNMGRFGNPEGQGNNTWKYKVGSVLSNYAPNREGLGQAAQFLQGQGVDVQQGGGNGDLLTFGSGITDENGNPIGTIDVGRGFGADGSGWAWQPQSVGGGMAGGGGGTDLNGAFNILQQMVPPNASKEQMEAAITQAFQGVPGFQGAYKESVNINGQWYDLVGGYGGASPSWQMMAKNDHATGTGFTPSLGAANLASGQVPGLQTGGDPTYAQKFLEMLLGDLGMNG
jgi:hypothetical protein